MEAKKRKRKARYAKKQKHTAASRNYHIPHDIVESILSRLPVKSLLRFKGVCKQWSATIADPKFTDIHFKRSNTSSCSYLEYDSQEGCLRRIRLQNNEFQKLPIVEYPLQGYGSGSCWSLLSHCDGIFLFSCTGSSKQYLVWNPSTRMCKQVRCTCPHSRSMSGICYDSLQKNYKVVIGDSYSDHYAVYYCKTNSWSKLKKMNINNARVGQGVYFKGSVYWISSSSGLKLEDGRYTFEIICFSGRDEKFKTLENYVYSAFHYAYSRLISSRDCLYAVLVPSYYKSEVKKFNIYKKVGNDDTWLELELELPFPCKWVQPLCSMTSPPENQIMLGASYGATKRYVTLVQTTARNTYSNLFPSIENLRLL